MAATYRFFQFALEWLPVTTFTVRQGSPVKSRADLLVVGVLQSDAGPTLAAGAEDLHAALGRSRKALLANMAITGKPGEAVRLPSNGVVSASTLLLVGLGPQADVHGVRQAAGVAARSVGNSASVALALPADTAELVAAITQGWFAGGYSYKHTEGGVAEVALLTSLGRTASAQQAAAHARRTAELVNLARDWGNAPPNRFTPADFANAVHTACAEASADLTCTVYDEQQLTDLNCGGIVAVGQGSSNPPRLVRIDYTPAEAQRRVALVGKGVTFDSGGLSIKPAAGMSLMKADMVGAAAAVAATIALAEQAVPVQITTWLPMAENLLSGTGYRPGDVLTMHNGLTVEVTNTDAEGRLILADALAMAADQSPEAILTVATLTGACKVALGDRIGGLFGDAHLVEEVKVAGDRVGEAFWPMPIPEHVAAEVRNGTTVADLTHHINSRWGAASFAAAFLREFTAGLPFVHLDMYGPSFNSGSAHGDVPSGATGFAARTIIEWVNRFGVGPGGRMGETPQTQESP